MTVSKALVLDANILIRAVLGKRVRQLLMQYKEVVDFYSPDVCFRDAKKHLPKLLERRHIELGVGLDLLDQIGGIVESIDQEAYIENERLARKCVERRDPDDWPVIAVALLVGCPIWTEDQDFFGSGIATWTTDRVEIYLRGASPSSEPVP